VILALEGHDGAVQENVVGSDGPFTGQGPGEGRVAPLKSTGGKGSEGPRRRLGSEIQREVAQIRQNFVGEQVSGRGT